MRRNNEPQPEWLGLSISRAHSCASYCFSFALLRDEKGRLRLTGECRSKKGVLCEREKGVRLKKKTVAILTKMRLQDLPEYRYAEEDPELMICDLPVEHFAIRPKQGLWEEKAIPPHLFSEIEGLLREYFE